MDQFFNPVSVILSPQISSDVFLVDEAVNFLKSTDLTSTCDQTNQREAGGGPSSQHVLLKNHLQEAAVWQKSSVSVT